MARDDRNGGAPVDGLELGLKDHDFAWARAAAAGPTLSQSVGASLALGGAVILGVFDAPLGLRIAHLSFFALFALAVTLRSLAVSIAKPPRRIPRLDPFKLPSYSVIVPLYREAEMVSGLISALARLDYPKDRLQILIVLEADDAETLNAVMRVRTGAPLQIVIAPPGAPQTKPRACNVALARAVGEHVVVYDAEDRPHPLQLQEAAARFAGGGETLACLQAPLRIAAASGLVKRQFMLEYAAQFEIVLPALARIGAPFPLGGTSNHFRTEALRAVGGWDAWNVTEDADLGFRLAALGWRSGLLRTPTWESAPQGVRDWLPQRTRWLKGYMQTWGVHMRTPFAGGAGRCAALQATLGLAILSAFAHGPVLLLLATVGVTAAAAGRAPALSMADLSLLVSGWASAILAMSAGARRARVKMRLADAIAAPLYWALQSIAFALAVRQICTRPHHWAKTPHRPPDDLLIGEPPISGGLDENGEASVRRAA
jgi:hypothetical protein